VLAPVDQGRAFHLIIHSHGKSFIHGIQSDIDQTPFLLQPHYGFHLSVQLPVPEIKAHDFL